MSTPQLVNANFTEAFSPTLLEMKPDSSTEMSVEEERDLYRQRFQSLQMVVKEIQQQLSQYKNRCSGVETVTLLLKESKQEVGRLHKHCKVLESAVVNLQNRLSTNGLSSSINIEETELFVPGASKQTLDNLARENARLRSLLKSTENQVGKKSSEDIQVLKSQIETLESENSKLQVQNDDMMVQIKEQVEAISLLRAQKSELSDSHSEKIGSEKDNKMEMMSQGTQTVEVAPPLTEKLKESLQQMMIQCSELALQLESAQTVREESFVDKVVVRNLQNAEASSEGMKEELLEWKKKYEEVVVMNQRWQQHNETQEKQMVTYLARIAELEDPETVKAMVTKATAASKREAAAFKAQLEAVAVENEELKRRIDLLNQEIVQLRTQPAFDVSIVEILKQQIQACTEDFNSERKDREQAVQRLEQLQHEYNSVKVQKEKLQADFESLKQTRAPQFSPQRREAQSPVRAGSSSPSPPISQFRARGPATLQGPIPDRLFQQYASHQPIRQTVPTIARDSEGGYSSAAAYPRHEAHVPSSEFLSLQRPAMDFDMLPELEPYRGNVNASMPVLSASKPKAGTGELSCPKCGTQFQDGQDGDLIKHMDNCTA